jgi:hypothetical protein
MEFLLMVTAGAAACVTAALVMAFAGLRTATGARPDEQQSPRDRYAVSSSLRPVRMPKVFD